jgi:hypothetical protein
MKQAGRDRNGADRERAGNCNYARPATAALQSIDHANKNDEER